MHETPASLLHRLCQQPVDRDWERFVLLFTPMLSRWAHRLGVPAADVEDVLQETFTLLVRTFPQFRYNPQQSFRAWLWTIFHRHVSGWRKRQTRNLALSDAQVASLASADNVAEAAEEEYRRALLDRALQLVQTDFPQQTWQMFLQVAVAGRPSVEVAREFGVTANAVYLARGRILARLREELLGLDS